MPRRKAELNPADGPVPAFACHLRAKQDAAGLTYRAIAARTHYSHVAFVNATSGSTLPTWDVTREFLRACGIEQDALEDWEQRWQNTKAAVKAPATPPTAAAAPSDLPSRPDVPDAAAQPPEHLRLVLALQVGAAQINAPGDFALLLRALKKATGDPPIRELARRADIPRSTLADLLNPRRRRFDWHVVTRYLYACGVDWQEFGRWQTAFARVTSLAETSTPPHRPAEVSATPETTTPTAIPPATTRRQTRLLMTATMITIIMLLITVAVVLLS
jgi:hypothetical protein